MSVSSRREIVDNVLDTTRQERSQIGSLTEEYLNLTLNEINCPGWAFPRKNYNYQWNFLREKTTFSTVSGTSDYVLPREIEEIASITQRATPIRLSQIDRRDFNTFVPDPSNHNGNPRGYMLWENEGVSTALATADTIDVVSSSASDAGSSDYTVTVVGYDSNGILQSEVYTLNGKTAVSGTQTFAAREIYVSKRSKTNGNITITENSGGTTLVVLGKEERAPRFKVITLHPIPSSAITMYVEYNTRIRELTNDSDVPNFNDKWHYVVRLGTLAKVFQYLNKEQNFIATHQMYAAGVRAMVAADKTNPDLVRHLLSRQHRNRQVFVGRRNESGVIWN